MAKKRARYRVRPGPKPGLEVALVKGKSTIIPGEIENVSEGGIGVFFPERKDPRCALRDTVHLRISSPHLSDPIYLAGVVCSSQVGKAGVTYGMEVVDWLGLLRQLPPPLNKLFNKRGDWRVEAHPDLPIEVTLEAPPHKIRGILQDLSPGGVSVLVPTLPGAPFQRQRKLTASFFVPQCGEQLSFAGEVVHAILTGQGVRYGISFNPSGTYGFKQNQNLLQRYLHSRRRLAAGLPVEA